MSVGSIVKNLIKDERGGTAIEYGLVLGLIVLGMFAALSVFSSAAIGTWTSVSKASNDAVK